MQKEGSNRRIWWNVIFAVTAAIIIIADQVSKTWIRAYTGDFPIFQAGIFRIIRVGNTGSSFGMFQEKNIILMIVAIIGIILVISLATLITLRYPVADTWQAKLILGMIMGGAAGNLIDRIARGFVTDWIDIGPWPTFNIADSSMVIGVILLACYVLFSKRIQKAFSH